MNTECFLKEAKTCALNIDQDDVFEIVIGGIKSMRSKITSVESEDSLELSELLEKGCPIPLEFLHLDVPSDKPRSGFYVTEVLDASKNFSSITFREIETGETLEYRLLFNHEGGISSEGASALDPDFNDFAFSNYVNWCGKWRGRHKQWRFCTGGDCALGHGICIQRRF